MLDKFLDYGRQENLFQEPGFDTKMVRWVIECDESGIFKGVVPLGEDKKGQKFSGVPHLSQGELTSGKSSRSHFLVESLQTMIEWHPTGASERDIEKTQQKHCFFKEMLREAGKEIGILHSAWLLLNNQEQKNLIQERLQQLEPKPKPTDSAVVRVNGQNPLRSPAWHSWWKQYRQELQGAKPAKSAQERLSFLSGAPVIPVPTHPKIKGTSSVGGLATGDVLVGFDKDAFTSFGLKQSANAAMSEVEAKQYSDVLNYLIGNQRFRFGNTLCVYWYSQKIESEEDPLFFLEKGDDSPSAIDAIAPKKILKSLREGNKVEKLQSAYYSTLLSGNSGRVMIRAWEETSFETLLDNIAKWFEDFSIVHREGGKLAPSPKFMAVVGATVRDLKEAPSPMIVDLWQAATLGRDIPESAFAKTFLRIKNAILKDDPIQHASIGLLKAYHCRKHRKLGKEEPMQPYLNPEHPEPAYHCGRLLAILARLQRSALGDVGAGVVQRYYGAACQTPSLTIGRLMTNAKNHLNKLDSLGLADWYEQQIAAIMGAMQDGIPATLTLEEQSLFALGYYQQLARPPKSKKDENSSENDTQGHE